MPTKKGSSKAGKAKKASNKRRKSPKRGVSGRAGATRRVATGRVTAAGAGGGTSKKAPDRAAGPNPGIGMPSGPEGSPDRKATGPGIGSTVGGERIRDL